MPASDVVTHYYYNMSIYTQVMTYGQATVRGAGAIDRNSSGASTSTLWLVGIECTAQPESRLSASYVAVKGVAGQPLA